MLNSVNVNLNSFKLSKSSKPKIISRSYSVSILLLFFPDDWLGHHHLDKLFHLFVGNDETKILYFPTFHHTIRLYIQTNILCVVEEATTQSAQSEHLKTQMNINLKVTFYLPKLQLCLLKISKIAEALSLYVKCVE